MRSKRSSNRLNLSSQAKVRSTRIRNAWMAALKSRLRPRLVVLRFRGFSLMFGIRPALKLHATIRVTVFLLDSLFPAGYGYEREQARGGLLMKPCRYLCKLKAKLALSAR